MAATPQQEVPLEQPAQENPSPAPPQPAATLLEQVLHATDNRPPEVQRFEFHQRSAKLFALSGLFADIKGQSESQAIAQAYVKISLGESMGFNPAESMTGIDIIVGRVAVGANLRAARMQRAGYSWDMLQLDDKGCRLRLKLNGKHLMCEDIDQDTGEVTIVPVVVSFMLEDATKAGLAGKDNYRKNPRNMFFARAITNAQRWYAPGILGADILSTEEAVDLEPQSTQDPRLAAKAATVAAGIKERYKKTDSGGGASAGAGTADPLSASEPRLETPAPEILSKEQAQAKLEDLRAQVAVIEGRGPAEPPSVSETPSEPLPQPLLDGSAIPADIFDERGSERHSRRRR